MFILPCLALLLLLLMRPIFPLDGSGVLGWVTAIGLVLVIVVIVAAAGIIRVDIAILDELFFFMIRIVVVVVVVIFFTKLSKQNTSFGLKIDTKVFKKSAKFERKNGKSYVRIFIFPGT